MNKTYKIYVLEDNQDLIELYELVFSNAGFEVGKSDRITKEAIAEILKFKPDVILLDLMMPWLDGYTFLKALKKSGVNNMKIVVNSNLSQQQDMDKAFALGASQYLRKDNYSPKDLVSRIKFFLGEKIEE